MRDTDISYVDGWYHRRAAHHVPLLKACGRAGPGLRLQLR